MAAVGISCRKASGSLTQWLQCGTEMNRLKMHNARLRLFPARGAVFYTQRCYLATSSRSSPDPRDAVVKIFNTRQRPGWTVPWQTQPVESSTGSGALISWGDGVAVLTAAHVIADTRHLQIQRSVDRFSSDKVRVHVAAVCHDADLALLRVEKPEAVEGINPLKLGPADSLPEVFDKVHVVGYPVGGDAVSVTEGVLSRVEVQEYSHSVRPALALTVDAAINSGNSGGPVLDAGSAQILGVAFQKLVARGVELQGHAVPAPLIHQFLDEVSAAGIVNSSSSSSSSSGSTRSDNENVSSSGAAVQEPLRLRKPSLGCDIQPLEAAALRRSLGMGSDQHGVLVNRLQHSGPAQELRAGDVLLSFNDLNLDDAGVCTVFGRRLCFRAARDLHAVGGTVPLRVWRQDSPGSRTGQELVLQHRLMATEHLVSRGQYDCMAPFFVCGGFVFQPLSHEYLQGWNVSDRPNHLQALFQRGCLTPERLEVVILSGVLADEVNTGYDSGWVGAPIVGAVNGCKIRSLAHLVEVVREAVAKAQQHHQQQPAEGGASDCAAEEFLEFEMETAGGPQKAVLPTLGVEAANKRVHQLYGVPASGCSHHFMM